MPRHEIDNCDFFVTLTFSVRRSDNQTVSDPLILNTLLPLI